MVFNLLEVTSRHDLNQARIALFSCSELAYELNSLMQLANIRAAVMCIHGSRISSHVYVLDSVQLF